MTFWDGSFELDESNGSLGKLFLDTALWLRILKLPVWRCCTPDYRSYVLFLLLHRSTNNKDWQYGNVLHICINLIIILNRGDKYRQIMFNIWVFPTIVVPQNGWFNGKPY